MRKAKTILVACMVASSLYVAAGTAWARSESLERGTSWTDVDAPTGLVDPAGVSWEESPLSEL
ncbi:MAG: hypothetical protein E6J15_02120 [Chloroflexi bacterium]|nr:MAG: hypothetical protein E6J15_02120 [Chloroflexota bacterium]